MTDGKIYIYITDKAPAGTLPVVDAAETESKKKDNDNSLFAHWARDKLIGTAKSVATKAATYSISNIGNFTGDYITQTHINDSLNNLNAIIGIGTAAIAGAKIGGPWGAVIATTLSVINEGVSSALSIHSARVQNRKINYEIEQLRIRSGLNTIMDGSRGTEN